MISINDVNCEYLWNGNQCEWTEDVKKHWNSLNEQERSQYLTMNADRIKFSAKKYCEICLNKRKRIMILMICMTGYG